MILEVGKLGINMLQLRSNNSRHFTKIIINKNLNIGSFVLNSVFIEFDDYRIRCVSEEDADNLFKIINNHYDGTRQEKLERILKDDE